MIRYERYAGVFICGLFGLWSLASHAGPFAPAAREPNSTAIACNWSGFVGWATEAMIEQGLRKIDEPQYGYVSNGSASDALGQAEGGITTGVVSLGDGGKATLIFEKPIADGPGYDFAVFENGFNMGSGYFCELAFVEVSSDGFHYVRFPAVSLTQTRCQLSNNGTIDPTEVNNLAGKYEAGYGVPFDLEEVKDVNELVDVGQITRVRLVDVVGNIFSSWTSYDSLGNPINDPWPTPFPVGGFDLDGVGVIHQKTLPADFTCDGIVDYSDFAVFSSGFLGSGDAVLVQKLDIALPRDGQVEIDDFMVFLDSWLATESWRESTP